MYGAPSSLPTGVSPQPETLQLEQLKADIYKETWIQISAVLSLASSSTQLPKACGLIASPTQLSMFYRVPTGEH